MINKSKYIIDKIILILFKMNYLIFLLNKKVRFMIWKSNVHDIKRIS